MASIEPPRASRLRAARRTAAAGLVLVLLGLLAIAYDEAASSRRQARRLAALGADIGYRVEPGPSPAIRFPGHGPYDERLGYGRLPELTGRLEAAGFAITAQARQTPQLLRLADRGLFTPYREKAGAGLTVRECTGATLSEQRYPERLYAGFGEVPTLLVDTLLFIEDRELLDPQQPSRNPAIDWGRFGLAAFEQVLHRIDPTRAAPGGSTLATQIEKYRHSPDGRTASPAEKLRQIQSASVRAYLGGEDTRAWRRQIVVDYLNTVPLSAQAGHGEVNGLGDGLWTWYGRDFAGVNRLLRTPIADAMHTAPRRALAFRDALLPLQARAYKEALSLMVAQRRPSYYLGAGESALRELTNRHLRLLAAAGVIPVALRDAALPIELALRPQAPASPAASFVQRKGSLALRTRLGALLDIAQPYALERLDLAASATLDGAMQQAATRFLRSLADPQAAHRAGLYGYRLLDERNDSAKLAISFTLYERGESANLLRVQADNLDQPFDLNEGARLDLGSTAKLRTLVSYLEIVAELHARFEPLDLIELAALRVDRDDPLAVWAREHLMRAKDRGLAAMLEAAMQRRYSASPAEGFYTGGGLHTFVNFEPQDNGRVVSVAEALTRSVNLPFIRLMRDLVRHLAAQRGDAAALLQEGHPQRRRVLERFADQEGREFLLRFHRKYRGMSAQQIEERLADERAAAGMHPLELWVARALRERPRADAAELIARSAAQRQEAYAWLFKSRHKQAVDLRIRRMLEQDAFAELLRRWKRLGYPFDALTPSYATAIGASGDRPAALAELMGIVLNGGVRRPIVRIAALDFAAGTPYETRMSPRPTEGVAVLRPEVAAVVRQALVNVVEDGTAKRLKGAFTTRAGRIVTVGGKTGTGDQRFETFGRGGKLIESRVVNRTATFAFILGERWFGTVMAYVPEPDAADYRFTSALPAQLLKSLAPTLLPLFDSPPRCGTEFGTPPAIATEARRVPAQ